MKRIMIFMLVIMLAFVFAGCGRHYAMLDRKEMYMVPGPPDDGVKEITVISYASDPVLDLAEGGEGRVAWPATVWDSGGKEKKERLLALNLFDYISDNRFLMVYYGPKKDLSGCRVGLIDRGGHRAYNHTGKYMKISDKASTFTGKVEFENIKEFLPEISPESPFIAEIKKGSREYDAIVGTFMKFRLLELEQARVYAYKKYNTNLSREQWEAIAEEDSVVRGLKQWLGEGWILFVTYPFIGLDNTAIIAGIAKVFQLPSVFGEKIQRPGYMEYVGDSEHTAKMILRALDKYKSIDKVSAVKTESTPTPVQEKRDGGAILPDIIKEKIKKSPCGHAQTYHEYNMCVLNYNMK